MIAAAVAATVIALAALDQPPLSSLEAALVFVESRNVPSAVSNKGARGLWQVMPVSACARVGLRPSSPTPTWRAVACRVLGRSVADLWQSPPLSRLAGRAILARYRHRCAGDVVCALRAYNCGNRGIKGKCGNEYAAQVLANASTAY